MNRSEPYRNRTQAGRTLAEALEEEISVPEDGIVLALPRGGLPVAYEVARHLELPLDLILVRKLGLPGQPELAMGAIASGDVRFLNQDVVSAADVGQETIGEVEEEERQELKRREEAYRGDRPPPEIEGRTVILVDDGIATGSTARAAIRATRKRGAGEVILAVPVSSPDAVDSLRDDVARIICPMVPDAFRAIGAWYQDFAQVSDDEVREILERAWEEEDLRPGSHG